ncbi:MAG: hypothetical protein IKG56_02515 [Clostridia bacterium]|nr:hypothetical protein [Clostridia bacterium]
MKKKNLIKYVVIITIVWACFLVNNNSYALEDPDSYSELYKQYLELSDEEKAKVEVIPEKYSTPFQSKGTKSLLKNTDMPSSYNLADHYEFKVENQGEEGNCWTFASIETLESYLQIHGYGLFDFSENHLNYIESDLFTESDANREVNTGGNYTEFQDYMYKKLGPVDEKDFPYYEDEKESNYKEYSKEELPSLLDITPKAYIGEFEEFPSVNKVSNDYSDAELTEFRNQVKKHIIDNGALFTSIIAPTYFTGEFYNDETNSAYFPNMNDYRFYDHSHAVAIIGWDDNYSKENFCEENRPEHDGAYIAINSWGKDFGENGLYHISYDDVYVEMSLFGVKEAVTDVSQFSNTKTFNIKDKNLYDALKRNIGRKITGYNDEKQEITMISGLLNQITYFDLSDSNISDLSGIENFTSLDNLQLEYNNISDISPLKALHKLTSIDLSHNNLTSIPSEIKDSEIMQLSLNYNPIADFSGLQLAKSITNLQLEGTSITQNDLVYLKNLHIVSLNLANTSIKDFSDLKNLDNDKPEDRDVYLQTLSVSHIDNIICESIPEVSTLDISFSNIDSSKFAQIPLEKMINLNISYTDITDLSMLEGNKLYMIDLSGNKNINNLDKIKNVASITYKNGGITDLSIFNDFEASELYLSENEITDYSVIDQNENVYILDLSYNNISDISYIDGKQIFLEGNYIMPRAWIPYNVRSIKKQTYIESLKVDITRDNIFQDIAANLSEFHENGINFQITNATIDYDKKIFKIDDYDKDVVIKFLNGNFEGSSITYKIERIEGSEISYIFLDRSKIKNIYLEGDSISKNDITVYAYYDNDSCNEIADYTIEGGDSLIVGENEIIIKKDNFENYISAFAVPKDSVIELNFENKDIYSSVLNQLKEMEKERIFYPDYYDHTYIIVDSNDSKQKILMLKEALMDISYLNISNDEITKIDDIKQLKGLSGISLNGKNIEDISALKTIKSYLDSRDDLMDYEKYIGLSLKNNEKITSIDDNIYNSLTLNNTKIESINSLTNLKSIQFTGNKMLEMDNLVDKLRIINISVKTSKEDTDKDEEGNIILPKIIKTYKDKGFEINATIYDKLRDEHYINSADTTNLELKELNGNIIIDYNDLKELEYNGIEQYIEVNIVDNNYEYADFSFKYLIDYKVFDSLELEKKEPIEIEEDSIPDLSDVVIYKVYSNKEKEKITDFEYDKNPVNEDIKSIEISYSEDGITKTINVPITVTEHMHEWGEWIVTKEPTENEEGQKERVCLKNKNHKEIATIDKLPEIQYKIIEGADQTIKDDTSKDLIIKINGDYELFDKLYIDKKEVDTNNYRVSKENTLITISSDFLNTLSAGMHSVRATYINDKEVTTTLTIAKNETNSDDNKNNNETENKNEMIKTNNNITTNSPKTEDNIMIYVFMLVLSMVGLIGTGIYIKKIEL